MNMEVLMGASSENIGTSPINGHVQREKHGKLFETNAQLSHIVRGIMICNVQYLSNIIMMILLIYYGNAYIMLYILSTYDVDNYW